MATAYSSRYDNASQESTALANRLEHAARLEGLAHLASEDGGEPYPIEEPSPEAEARFQAWYRVPTNGGNTHVLAPLSPEEARSLGGEPIPPPSWLSERLGGMIRSLAAVAPQGEAENLSDEARRGSPVSASPSGTAGVAR